MEIAALQWAAIHARQEAEDAMTSPYLDHVRSAHKTIEELIDARESELTNTTTAKQRARVERDLTFLREELARIDARQAERTTDNKQSRVAPK